MCVCAVYLCVYHVWIHRSIHHTPQEDTNRQPTKQTKRPRHQRPHHTTRQNITKRTPPPHTSALDPEAARELDEKEALSRAQERMSLRHRNTSKWAKHAQRTQGATAQVCVVLDGWCW